MKSFCVKKRKKNARTLFEKSKNTFVSVSYSLFVFHSCPVSGDFDYVSQFRRDWFVPFSYQAQVIISPDGSTLQSVFYICQYSLCDTSPDSNEVCQGRSVYLKCFEKYGGEILQIMKNISHTHWILLIWAAFCTPSTLGPTFQTYLVTETLEVKGARAEMRNAR